MIDPTEMKILIEGKEIDVTINSIELPVLFTNDKIEGFSNPVDVSVSFSLTKKSTKRINNLIRELLPRKPKMTWRDIPAKKKGKK
ncbi:hypothetical protein A9G13_02155 [Gilliamella sp. wkB178]|uniref:hypothetical protein n=1 Tax=Gilliamella sp. wkB178 TaxID=3120259 RepID=UPI00080E154E|nr:hypothetical protein [Gilliamella apicola]OCG08886.1 hypothetical protein A9G13_02155 [Gilliamella apicola]